MKGDFTRLTFNPEKHFSRVLMQQGRVQLDADWNEQLDIAAHRVETETVDALGSCAAPIHNPAFGVVIDPNDLPTEERQRLEDLGLLPLATGDFLLTHGRFYVDGILCENEQAIPFTAQPDLPGAEPVTDPVTYLAYLDVWQRHITFLEAASIREVALGGPDTTTRSRTVWQVRLLPVAADDLNCLSDLEAWDQATAASTGMLSARAQPEVTSTDPCIVPPSAGFRGLQNQLYRVEIHAGGELGNATFKWSRDNGSLVFAIEEFMDGMPTDRVRVRTLGRDKDLALRVGNWVEVLDDNLELHGLPGTLAQITDIDTDDLIVTLNQDISGIDTDLHPKLRCWDSAGTLDVVIPGGNNGFIPLEEGVEIKFEAGSYKTGDYWLIPARTILGNPELTQTGGIEWPMDGADPLPQSAFGIEHHYCRLALLHFDGTTFSPILDCRPFFPPATELINLFYVSGDGQEAMPGNFLPQPLQAGVSNGQWPVENAWVRFQVILGNGTLTAGPDSGSDLLVATESDGVASVTWQLDATELSQRVEATLVDAAGDPLHLPVRYNANLSVADQVAYDAGECSPLAEVTTVQDAIDELCHNAALYYVGGDGQETQPGERLPKPLEVRLANGHWPVAGQRVIFRIVEPGGGTLFAGADSGPEVVVPTDTNGYAACEWQLDDQNPSQTVIAFWSEQPDLFIHFNANLELESGGGTDPAIRIKQVTLLSTGAILPHDSVISVLEIATGIRVELDQNPDPLAVRSKPVCFVTLDLPFPFNTADFEVWGSNVIGFRPLILDANVVPDDNAIHWLPTTPTTNFLVELLFARMVEFKRGDRVLAHLTLKGNFIWAEEEPRRYLDGNAFGAPEGTTPSNLRLPSGDGKRGGDFEMWFTLIA